MVDKTVCSNCRGISLLSTSYKIVFNILVSRVSPYIDEIIGDHQCGFGPNRSTTYQISCIPLLEKNWEYNETIHQLFINFKISDKSLRREVFVLHSHRVWGTLKPVTLIKMCVN
jgi:hypothetical protein